MTEVTVNQVCLTQNNRLLAAMRSSNLVVLSFSAKRAMAPRPASATSIPGLLKCLQNEYDAQMLETFQLKKHLDAARQELSQALYQHDAACRVIARVVKERDEARAALSNASSYAVAAAAAAGSAGMRGLLCTRRQVHVCANELSCKILHRCVYVYECGSAGYVCGRGTLLSQMALLALASPRMC
jgi:hypothetical protein